MEVLPKYLVQHLFWDEVIAWFHESRYEMPRWVIEDPYVERFLSHMDPANPHFSLPNKTARFLLESVLPSYIGGEARPVIESHRDGDDVQWKLLEAYMAGRRHFIGDDKLYLALRLDIVEDWQWVLDPQSPTFCPDPLLRDLMYYYATYDFYQAEPTKVASQFPPKPSGQHPR